MRNAYTAGEDHNAPAWSIPQTMDCSCDTPCSYTTYVSKHSFVSEEELNGYLESRWAKQLLMGVVKSLLYLPPNWIRSYIQLMSNSNKDYIVQFWTLSFIKENGINQTKRSWKTFNGALAILILFIMYKFEINFWKNASVTRL